MLIIKSNEVGKFFILWLDACFIHQMKNINYYPINNSKLFWLSYYYFDLYKTLILKWYRKDWIEVRNYICILNKRLTNFKKFKDLIEKTWLSWLRKLLMKENAEEKKRKERFGEGIIINIIMCTLKALYYLCINEHFFLRNLFGKKKRKGKGKERK